MTGSKKLSLITACYNSELTIADTLKSVSNQTYQNIEHILVDGGSTDSTMDLVSVHGQRINKSISEKDGGIYDAYNKGLNLAEGDIIGFINSDDFYYTDDVIAQVMSVFEDPLVDACHANLFYVDPLDTTKIERIWKSWNFKNIDFERGYLPGHPTIFLRKKIYEQYGNFSTQFNAVGDVDFVLRIFYGEKINSIHVDKIWVCMRSGGATGGDSLASIFRQSLDIRSAQRQNGIESSLLIYWWVKITSRSSQIVKARFSRLKDLLVRS